MYCPVNVSNAVVVRPHALSLLSGLPFQRLSGLCLVSRSWTRRRDASMAEYGYYEADSWSYQAEAGGTSAQSGWYGDDQGAEATQADAEYAATYWRLDEEVRVHFYELAPDAQGESVPLSDLGDLCLRMGRPIHDANEQSRLMLELDTTNQMLVLRHDFITWMLRGMLAERAADNASQQTIDTFQLVPVAQHTWEEIVDPIENISPLLAIAQPTTSTYYSNVITGESQWALPSFARALWLYMEAIESRRASFATATTQAEMDAAVEQGSSDSSEMIHDLRRLFTKYDEDSSGALDCSEFEDLCVAIGQKLDAPDALLMLMQEVDPFTPPPQVVSWDAFSYYWTTNAPFQRRTRLDGAYRLWECVEVLHHKSTPLVFRHSVTQQERWNHPNMEQTIVATLLQLFPSKKMDWKTKIKLFIDVQLGTSDQQAAAKQNEDISRAWDASQCKRALTQMGHVMTRKAHLENAVKQIQQRFGLAQPSSGDAVLTLGETTVTEWFLYSIKKVEMNGWEQVSDVNGQVYFYHEVDGITQWDPPQQEAKMLQLMSKFGEGISNDEKIARIFRQYDADESGSVTFDEFQPLYCAIMGGGSTGGDALDEYASAKMRQVFQVLDTSGDGCVSLEEFQLWWRTSLQLQEEESDESKRAKHRAQQRSACLAFLENANALVVKTIPGVPGEEDNLKEAYRFESNLLPRVVAVLGKYPLRGLVYRNALKELVHSKEQQEVDVDEFLQWYERFEAAEREKEELEASRIKAQAALAAKESQAKAKRKAGKRRVGQPATTKPESEEAILKRKIESLFKAFDTNGSGFLDEDELKQLTKALGHEMDDMQVHQMMQVIDSSGDHQVSLEEFMVFWTAFQRKHPTASTLAASRRNAALPEATGSSTMNEHINATEASASLAVSVELAKERILNFSLQDFKEALGDWKDELIDRRDARKKKLLVDQAEAEARERRMKAFIPTRKRRYAYFDVTWIEPEVVDCVSNIIHRITLQPRKLMKGDAAQRIQTLARTYNARVRVFRMIQDRFHQRIDLHTKFFYYVDTRTARIHLERPIFRTRTSSVKPYYQEDCNSKVQTHQFVKKCQEMLQKKRFYDRNHLAPSLEAIGEHGVGRLYVPAALCVMDIVGSVKQRLLNGIWHALRAREMVLIRLIAQRYRHQLQQRSSEAAAYLPLHYVVRNTDFPMCVIKSIARAYGEARTEVDFFGMTPLHLALRERRTNLQLVQLLARQKRTAWSKVHESIWRLKTKACKQTPLHMGILHHASVEIIRWIVQLPQVDLQQRNADGESAFHLAIRQFRAGSAYAKTVVLAFLKLSQAQALCTQPTSKGDLALHLAMDAFDHQTKQRQKRPEQDDVSSNEASDWRWLTQALIAQFPSSLLTKRRSNLLLPLHLAIKYGFPTKLTLELLQQTIDQCEHYTREDGNNSKRSVFSVTTIAALQMTLLHYAIEHQPTDSTLIIGILNAMRIACQRPSLPNDNLPLHSAAANASVGVEVLQALYSQFDHAADVYNKQRMLPLHLAITCGGDRGAAKVKFLLEKAPQALLQNRNELQGLRALVLASNMRKLDADTLLSLLEITPAMSVTADAKTRIPSVTPLFTLSMRKCSADVIQKGILEQCQTKFERIENQDAYFLAMAKAKMRRQHHCPTAKWEWSQILRLMELNPLDEAVLQRSLLAMNKKLASVMDQQSEADKLLYAGNWDPRIEAVTLDPELLIVRKLHQTMFEFPSNARIQLLGQSLMQKLLPTAFAKATYKSKIDPFFNL